LSEFLKFAYELIAQIIYNIAACFAAIFHLFIGGWPEYIMIFSTYFWGFNIVAKILAVILVIILVAIPVGILILLIRRWILYMQLKADNQDNNTLYKEIGRLNRQVLDLIDEKNKILALKVNTMGGTERIPYMGASALADDVIPNVGNVTGIPQDSDISVQAETVIVGGEEVLAGGNGENGTTATGKVVGMGSGQMSFNADEDAISNAAIAMATASAQAKAKAEADAQNSVSRFPKLSLVDEKYADYVRPEFNETITLEEFVESYRLFAASQLHLYYTPEIIRRFVAGMAASKILILEGISGTGKTSLPYSFSRFLCNPATIVSVQPSFRDRTELLGYFNEFSKRFNETEFLRALYEANYREDPSFIVLDEMNLARIEYYFAEMLSVLEMPSHDEWVLDLVPTAWSKDPVRLDAGKIHVSDTMWFIGTANNDDSTFTITDKVYDRAMPIELNERADAFECEEHPACQITSEHLQILFAQAKEEHPISESTLTKMTKLDSYLQTRFQLAFGNRIIKQMYDFIPVYVACGGTELDGMDYIIARKVLKKFESLNVSFVRDEIKGLISYMEKTFGKSHMQDSISYLQRIQNLY
jgi:hypothetical protein